MQRRVGSKLQWESWGIVFYAYNEVVWVRGGWVVFYEYADSIGMFYSSANLLVEYVLFY